MSKVGDVIKEFAPQIKAGAAKFFEDNKPALVEQLKKAEASAITELGALVVAGIAHSSNPFEAKAAEAIAASLTSLEGPILAALGGEDEALYQLAVHAAETELDVVIGDLEAL